MAPVSNSTVGDGLPYIYSNSAPNTARTSAKESRFDPNVQRQVWGASVRPAPPTQQRGVENAPARSPSGGSTGNPDFSLPALTPRISAVTLPASASAPLPNPSHGVEGNQDPTSAPNAPSAPLSSIPAAAATGFTPSPPRSGSGGRSPGARPTVGNTPTVTPGAAAAFADLENENKMLEEIFDDAREIIGIERDMKKAGGEYVIQKRMTSTYEIAAHLGVESAALAPSTQHTYVLKDPHSLQRSASPDGPQTPRQVISAGGALAPTPSAMRRLSLAPFLDPGNSPLLSGRRTNIQPASPNSTAPPGSYTPRTSTLANVTTLTPRRYDPAGDKSRYAQLFAEQQAMEKQQKESTVQYQSMLETYFKLQEEMKRRLLEDPWEMQADDFEDATVKNLKRRLSELVGIPLDGLGGPMEPARRSEVEQQQSGEDAEAA